MSEHVVTELLECVKWRRYAIDTDAFRVYGLVVVLEEDNGAVLFDCVRRAFDDETLGTLYVNFQKIETR